MRGHGRRGPARAWCCDEDAGRRCAARRSLYGLQQAPIVQTLDVLGGVVAKPVPIPLRFREHALPLASSEPVDREFKFPCGLGDRVKTLLLHVPTMRDTGEL